jgi:hypothetical protein
VNVSTPLFFSFMDFYAIWNATTIPCLVHEFHGISYPLECVSESILSVVAPVSAQSIELIAVFLIK